MTSPLAIDGGTPLRTAPLPAWPAFGPEAAAAVARVVESGALNYHAGEQGRTLEAEYAAALGRRHALAVANGTLALELALVAFGVGPGDEVVVPSRTFIATAGAVVSTGARPVVADIDPDSGCLTAETVRAVLSHRTAAVIPVHLGGWPAPMHDLATLAAEKGLVLIEDCAQAHGAMLDGRPAGALGSHAAAFSFCQDKIVAAGEGGLLVLDDDEAYERAWSHRDHGKDRGLAMLPGDGSSYRWLVQRFGTNWRLSELVAALAREGLRDLASHHAARTRHAMRLAAALAPVDGVSVPLPSHGAEHAFYRLYGLVDTARLAPGWSRDRVLGAIRAEGVPVQYGTCALIGREQAFARAGIEPGPLTVAERVHERSIAFFVHPTLADADVDDTAAAVAKVMEVACR